VKSESGGSTFVPSRLTFYSDGVVEAQNNNGELLGFERSRELSFRPAAEIASAAKA
jgi:serine phosphatase RsbU (regulator of sigma subunit)